MKVNYEKFRNRKSVRDNTPKGKSKSQEKRLAIRTGGRTTLASGAFRFDKSDVVVDNLKLRIECKRTDKDQIIIKRSYLVKVTKESRNEIPVIELEIGDQRWYIVRPEEFAYILNRIKQDEDAKKK